MVSVPELVSVISTCASVLFFFAVILDDRDGNHKTRLHLSENRQGLARCDCSLVTCLVCRFPGASHVQSDLHAHRRLGGGGRGVDCISTGTWNIEIHLV